MRDRLVGLVRLVHPFPIIVDAVATAAIALLAGGSPAVALRLAAAMLALQASIGALNDVVDAPRDAGLKPGKPIPAGFVSRREAVALTWLTAATGVILSAPSGAVTVAIGVAILAIGWAYDLRFKGTPWSWLPFAVGIPLLPVFAWLGAFEPLPAAFLALIPAAGLAGAALAIGNALVDVERDKAAGVTSIAAHLGPSVAWRLMTALYVVVAAIAGATALAGPAPGPGIIATGAATAVVIGGCAGSRAASPAGRERGWRLQCVGVALLAAAWLGATVVGLGRA